MSLRYAILGLLSISPMSGYEVKKHIDDSVAYFWSADQSQIYRTLAGLVENGYADRSTVVQTDRPNQHPHAITDAGIAALDAWLRDPDASAPVREPFLAKLFFVGRLDAPAARALLERRRASVQASLVALEEVEVDRPSAGLAPMLRSATRDNGLVHARAELAWIEETLARIGTLEAADGGG